MLQLVIPHIAYKDAMLEAAGEMYESGEWEITPAALEERFETVLKDLAAAWDPATTPPGVLPYIDYWLLEDTTWIGLLTLRPTINNELMRSGGHIGYVIRPSRRQQGYGTAILRLGLEQAKTLGMKRVLLTCADTNLGSRKIIEVNGGRLENILLVSMDSPPVRRYWIEL